MIDILVTHKHTALCVTWRSDLGERIYPNALTGVRWSTDSNSWSVPTLNAVELMQHLRVQYPHLRVSFDKGSADVIYKALALETSSSELALAENGDVPDVLSVQLLPFQRATLAYALRGLPRKIIALDTGLGKTAVACAYARIRQTKTLWITEPTLINNLVKEIVKLTGDKPVRLLGTNPNANDVQMLKSNAKHFVISNRTLANSLVKSENEECASLWTMLLTCTGFELLVIDEAHSLRNRETNMWKVAFQLRSIPSIMLLTATPAVNNGKDLFALLTLCDYDVWQSEAEFVRTYMNYNGKVVTQPRKLAKDILPYMFRRKKTDVLKDLPPKIRQHHSIEMTQAFRDAYNDVTDGLFTNRKGDSLEVPDSMLAKINRFRQVVSYTKVSDTVELAMQLEENGEKTLIFTVWKDTAEALAKELSCGFIHGDVPLDERTRLQDVFNNDKDCKHLVLTVATGGQGLNLTGGSAIIFNDYDWTPKGHEQAEGRVWGRLNDIHGCLIYYVEVQDSIDSFMMSVHDIKQRMIDAAVDSQKSFVSEDVSVLKEFLKYVYDHGAL